MTTLEIGDIYNASEAARLVYLGDGQCRQEAFHPTSGEWKTPAGRPATQPIPAAFLARWEASKAGK